jgi:hypothetical protein
VTRNIVEDKPIGLAFPFLLVEQPPAYFESIHLVLDDDVRLILARIDEVALLVLVS